MDNLLNIECWLISNKNTILLAFGALTLIILLGSSIYVGKQFLYPTYDSCSEAKKELARKKNKTNSLIFYKQQADEVKRLCK